jgi:hypothetical protein
MHLLVTTCTTNTDQANQPKNKKQPTKQTLRRSSAKQPLTTTNKQKNTNNQNPTAPRHIQEKTKYN